MCWKGSLGRGIIAAIRGSFLVEFFFFFGAAFVWRSTDEQNVSIIMISAGVIASLDRLGSMNLCVACSMYV